MFQELKHAFRALRRNPILTLAIGLTLAFGIGANTAVFSVIEAVLLRPLDYSQPSSLFVVREIVPALSHLYPELPANPKHFRRWTQQCSSFESLTQMEIGKASLTGAGHPEQIYQARVSSNFFHVLGVEPQLGRAFVPDEDKPGPGRTVVIADSLWRRRFSANPALLGDKILLDGTPNVVVGILPPSFRAPRLDSASSSAPAPEIFKPLAIDIDGYPNIGDFDFQVIGRLRPGVSERAALAEINVVQAQIASGLSQKLELRAVLHPLQEAIVGQSRRGLVMLLCAVGAVLLIVCVNLANLMLARMPWLVRESAIRVALGADRFRLFRQLLTETLLISSLGGALGVALAFWTVKLFVQSRIVNLPRLDEVGVNWTVLLFALGCSLLTAVAVGVLPAWRLSRTEPAETLRSGGRTSTGGKGGLRLGQILIGAEVAVSVALVIAAGLLLNSFVRLLHVNRGFETEQVLTLDLALPWTKYRKGADIDRFYTQLLAQISSLPGINSVGLVSVLPLRGESWVDAVSLEGDRRPVMERPMANYRLISSGYFQTMGIPLIAGRTIDDRDRSRKGVVIAEKTARLMWPGQSPIGKHFRRANDEETPYEVVGVAGDVRTISLQQGPGLMVYVPYWERPRPSASLVVRTPLKASGMASAVRSVVWAVDSDVSMERFMTMQDVIADSVSQRRLQLALVLLFAISSLSVGSIGIYGVVAQSVASRTNEIGVRMALGATTGDIYRLVFRQGMTPVLIGIAAGMICSLIMGRIITSLLFGVSGTDPITLVSASIVMVLVAAVACYLPARRASHLHPQPALRGE